VTAADLASVVITDEAREVVARLREQILSEQTAAYRRMRAAADTVTFSAAEMFADGQPGTPGPEPGTAARRSRCGAVSASWVSEIDYPDPASLAGGLHPGSYAPALRHVGVATGTSSPYEADAAWRLAIEAGTGEA
jgi:hypothetical protein